MFTETEQATFWSKVDKSGGPDACWPARGEVLKKCGHVRIRINYVKYQAHRVAYYLTHGTLPGGLKAVQGGLVVRHKCDNPVCCNPAHLLLGTLGDNTQDMHDRQRHTIQRRKLSPEKVAEARCMRKTMSLIDVAAYFGVSKSTMSVALSGKTWRRE